ncbi:MAG: protein TolR [Candidatus Anaerobiospirillum pullicola]|uniref:Tol-Pal system protein TolR n=1 Tax=Candidatus Anaerobiospirillum pullicola TaxID=2838451 RepID=A0A948WY65_9GAMM|nr:protein TolR [Candidatus Anaerobiospirillum pullicola]
MGERGRRKSRTVAEINVVPYIDVMLVLLVIFIATAPVVMQGVTVDLPQAEAEAMNEDQRTPIIATVDRVGQYYVSVDSQSTKVPNLDTVSSLVQEELRKDPSRPVVVQGDAQVAYDSVIQLMQALKQAGVESVGLMTEPMPMPMPQVNTSTTNNTASK